MNFSSIPVEVIKEVMFPMLREESDFKGLKFVDKFFCDLVEVKMISLYNQVTFDDPQLFNRVKNEIRTEESSRIFHSMIVELLVKKENTVKPDFYRGTIGFLTIPKFNKRKVFVDYKHYLIRFLYTNQLSNYGGCYIDNNNNDANAYKELDFRSSRIDYSFNNESCFILIN